jgi:hypothetical protein
VGGQIVGDASGDRISIALGKGASVTATAGICVSKGSGIMALRHSFGVRVAAIPAGRAGEPLTAVWTCGNACQECRPSRPAIQASQARWLRTCAT